MWIFLICMVECLNYFPGEYFDFSTIMPLLDREFGGIDTFKVYGAYMGVNSNANPNYKLFVKAQNEFFNSVKLNGVHFGQGSISKHGQEKGVDMQIGVDMVNDAHLKRFTDVVLLSGDADFNYPVDLVKKMGINFHYCSFATRHSVYLSWQGWRKVTLDYKNHFSTKVLPVLPNSPKKLKVCGLDEDVSVEIKSV